ncbi:MAG: YihY/virulence factor BrkB family protein [Bacteroidetes bacterium]|nr:YihY/virulence factor BrkB family protein [Bacteroidota bacterium]MCB0846841.1 YihY/virulence factor BrkB family protein [Bacteroidota bacterium]
MKFIKNTYRLLRDSIKKFNTDGAFRFGAAISYYTLISLPGMLIIIISLTGSFLGEAKVKGEILSNIEAYFGAESKTQVNYMIDQITFTTQSIWTTIIGVGTLIFGATGVFYTLKDSINTLWYIRERTLGGGIIKLLFDRILSLAMVISVGFILLVSMMLKTVIFALSNFLTNMGDSLVGILDRFSYEWAVAADSIGFYINVAGSLDFVITFFIFALMFALIFRFLPDARVAWRDIWRGAFFTAFMFTVGEVLLGLYIGNSNIANTYGAAGSVVLILVWFYYSAQILLLGAEFVWVYTESKGRKIEASKFTEKLQALSFGNFLRWLKRKKKSEAASTDTAKTVDQTRSEDEMNEETESMKEEEKEQVGN